MLLALIEQLLLCPGINNTAAAPHADALPLHRCTLLHSQFEGRQECREPEWLRRSYLRDGEAYMGIRVPAYRFRSSSLTLV